MNNKSFLYIYLGTIAFFIMLIFVRERNIQARLDDCLSKSWAAEDPIKEKKEEPKEKAKEPENVFKWEDQFSSWDGSHPKVVAYVKNTMQNPRSFEHDETRYQVIDDNTMLVIMKYRGSNAYGGIVTGYIQADVNRNGDVIKVY